MAEVTGPISTLPGAGHSFPDGTKCDQHPDRDAVVRIQGETDSMGCEMHDMCEECAEEHRAYMRSPEAQEDRKGKCEWCGHDATDLRDRRDYEEGMCGRVYRVCGPCVKRENDEALRDMDWFDDRDLDAEYDDEDPQP